MKNFSGKNILIGVSGGIATYKVCEIIRDLKKQGAACRVVMTDAAQKFITPLTFSTLAETPVLCDMFTPVPAEFVVHIEAARWADVVILCPATANLIGKVANGIADNLLTTIILATEAPVIWCPAMNSKMFLNPIVQQNIEKLKKFQYHFVEPGRGVLACNEQGVGRLAEKETILQKLTQVLFGTRQLAGKKILITAGRTEETLDPVRFLTNRSSGKMGFALAEAAVLRGAETTLISGPNHLTPFPGVNLVRVQSAKEMATAVFAEWAAQDALIMAAAVTDFRPARISAHKIKKKDTELSIELERTEDILAQLGANKADKILVGFAVETENVLKNSQEKLKAKNLDFIISNNPLVPGAGFGTDTNVVSLFDRAGTEETLPIMSKKEVAERILDKLTGYFFPNKNEQA
jgi:phosphopantothenoylcysteine decarboxylase/phosphopantothenate--cysteine ligase